MVEVQIANTHTHTHTHTRTHTYLEAGETVEAAETRDAASKGLWLRLTLLWRRERANV